MASNGFQTGWRDLLLFSSKFLRDRCRVAAVCPSSRALAAALCEHVDPTQPQTIVDLGSGTGAVTEAVLGRMHPESRVVAMEIDPEFFEILRWRCPRAECVLADAADLGETLRRWEVERLDVLISNVALPYLPRATNAAIFDCYQSLGRDGWFTQLTLVPLVYRRMYRRLFEEVAFRLVLGNLPPGGVYHCRRLRADYAAHLPGQS